jgi:hypothetical protein
MRTGEHPLRGVGQDKTAPKCVRIATIEPAPRIHLTRARQMNTLFSRSQNYFKDIFLTKISCISFSYTLAWVDMSHPAPDSESHGQPRKRSKKRQTVQVNLWVRPQLKAELKRIAEKEGLSISQTGGAALEEWIRQQLHIQHAVLLQPIIETTIRKEIRRNIDRLVLVEARNAYEAGWTRRIVSNVLKYLPSMTEEKLNTILDRSSIDARKHIFRKTPQMNEVSEEVRKTRQGEEHT